MTVFRGKKLLLILIIIAATLAAGTVISGTDVSAYSLSETVYYLSTFEVKGTANYYNGVDGCVYVVPIKEEAYENILSVTVTVVKLKEVDTTESTVQTDGENNVTSGHEIVKTFTVDKAEMSVYAQPNPNKYAYFEITATQWCAFVFTVKYMSGTEKKTAYDSEILYCRAIDNSVPEAYYLSWSYESGQYVFDVTVRGNKREYTLSADSGLKAFTVLKYSGGAWTKIEEITVSGGSTYNYRLKTTAGNAVYYVDIIDNVGNGARCKIVELKETTYDKGFESAVENQITELQSYDDFSEELKAELEKEYYTYFLLIQNSEASETEIKEAQNVVYETMAYIAELKKMKAEGVKEYTVLNPYVEYFGGNIEIRNSAVLASQKYGEKAEYIFQTSYYNPDGVDRTEEKKVLGISSAKELYTVNFTLRKDGTEVREEFSEPLLVKMPFYKGEVSVSVTYFDENGQKTVEKCKVGYGTDYTTIYLDKSFGQINIFIGSKADLRWLWFLTVIPVAAVIAVTVILIRRKKRQKIDTEQNK